MKKYYYCYYNDTVYEEKEMLKSKMSPDFFRCIGKFRSKAEAEDKAESIIG